MLSPRRVSDSQYEKLKKNRGKIHINRLLGKGCAGDVFMATSIDTGQIALKRYSTKITDPMFLSDIFFLSALKNHPQIVEYIGAITQSKGKKLYILMERCDTNLLYYILSTPFEKRNIHLYKLLNDTVEGMKYVHSQNILHLDLKPDNILVNFEYTNCLNRSNDVISFKITDFSHAVTPGHSKHHSGLTKMYRPPEVFSSIYRGKKPLLSESADIWALGVTVLEYLTGKNIFSTVNDSKLIMSILKFVLGGNKVRTKLLKKIGFLKYIQIKCDYIVIIEKMLCPYQDSRVWPDLGIKTKKYKKSRRKVLAGTYFNFNQLNARREAYANLWECIKRFNIDKKCFTICKYNFDKYIKIFPLEITEYTSYINGYFIIAYYFFCNSETSLEKVISHNQEYMHSLNGKAEILLECFELPIGIFRKKTNNDFSIINFKKRLIWYRI